MKSELGKLIVVYLINKKNSMTQHEFANAMDYSPSYISNIITGKKDPDLKFLFSCKKFFSLDKEETIDFFKTALTHSKNVPLDMAFLTQPRREILAKAIIALLFTPETELRDNGTMLPPSMQENFDNIYNDFLLNTKNENFYEIDLLKNYT